MITQLLRGHLIWGLWWTSNQNFITKIPIILPKSYFAIHPWNLSWLFPYFFHPDILSLGIFASSLAQIMEIQMPPPRNKALVVGPINRQWVSFMIPSKFKGAHRRPPQRNRGPIGGPFISRYHRPLRFPNGPAASRLGEAERLLVEAALSQMEEIRIRQAGRLGVKHPGLGRKKRQ